VPLRRERKADCRSPAAAFGGINLKARPIYYGLALGQKSVYLPESL